MKDLEVKLSLRLFILLHRRPLEGIVAAGGQLHGAVAQGQCAFDADGAAANCVPVDKAIHSLLVNLGSSTNCETKQRTQQNVD